MKRFRYSVQTVTKPYHLFFVAMTELHQSAEITQVVGLTAITVLKHVTLKYQKETYVYLLSLYQLITFSALITLLYNHQFSNVFEQIEST